jgi:hypothetical protein
MKLPIVAIQLNKGQYWHKTATDYETYETLYNMLVPSIGEADTKLGNILLGISTFGYNQYNNGHCNFQTRANQYQIIINILKLEDTSDFSHSANRLKKYLASIRITEAEFLTTNEIFNS